MRRAQTRADESGSRHCRSAPNVRVSVQNNHALRAPPSDLKPYFQTFDNLPGMIEWARFFGNDHPVEIDVGSGRGLFLVTAGMANPDINYLGIELDYKEGRRAAKRLMKREMANVRVLGGDVHAAFDKLIPPHSISAVHIYFPDPWWKRKHKKRRLFTDQFANQLAVVLEPAGLVHSWTDVSDYFDVIAALMGQHAMFETLRPPVEREATHDMDFQTSFERKKRKAGCQIYRGIWRRTAEL